MSHSSLHLVHIVCCFCCVKMTVLRNNVLYRLHVNTIVDVLKSMCNWLTNINWASQFDFSYGSIIHLEQHCYRCERPHTFQLLLHNLLKRFNCTVNLYILMTEQIVKLTSSFLYVPNSDVFHSRLNKWQPLFKLLLYHMTF